MLKIEQNVIRKIQLVQLDMLVEFDRICKKHDIKYQLFAGTLLGSIRHKGFIPWDDDIDLCLIREEYDRFLKIVEAELGEGYFLQTYETDPEYYKQSARLRKNNTIMMQKQFENLEMHHGIWLSIFPLDNVKPNTFLGSFQRAFYQSLLIIMTRVNDSRSIKSCRTRSGFKKVVKYGIHYLGKLFPKKFTDKLLLSVATMFNSKETKYISHLTNGVSKKRYRAYRMERKDFYDVITGTFEGHNFPIPKNYDSILTNLYGNYLELPPIEDRAPHHKLVKVEFKEV